LRYCLGSAKKHTVYEGECTGLVLEMELLQQERELSEVSICVDSQAAILAAASNKSQPGHHILDEFHRQQHVMINQHQHMAILICWTPGHHQDTRYCRKRDSRCSSTKGSRGRHVTKQPLAQVPLEKNATQQISPPTILPC